MTNELDPTQVEIVKTNDGSNTLRSHHFDVIYHSKFGALQETMHVFLAAGFVPVSREKSDVKVLEIGFGTGLNALALLDFTATADITIHYTTLEKYPLSWAIVESLDHTGLFEQDWSVALRQMHTVPSHEAVKLTPTFTFEKHIIDFQKFVPTHQYDVIFFDAFAPETQPEFWEVGFLTKMYDLLREGGVLVTYCSKGSFKRSLKAAGFQVTNPPGPPGKREMTKAIKL